MIYLLSNQDRELVAFGRIQLGLDGQPGPIEVLAERGDAELQTFAITDDGATAVLLWNVAGRNELSFLELSTLENTPGPALPMDVVLGMTFSPNGQLLALSTVGATAPRNIWVYDRETGRLWQVTHSPHAGVELATLVRPDLVRFPARCINPTASAHPAHWS
jgi:dipeptidyl aminopeptidase/acylaminoacyl peptidase